MMSNYNFYGVIYPDGAVVKPISGISLVNGNNALVVEQTYKDKYGNTVAGPYVSFYKFWNGSYD